MPFGTTYQSGRAFGQILVDGGRAPAPGREHVRELPRRPATSKRPDESATNTITGPTPKDWALQRASQPSLEGAVERELIPRNPAKGKSRRAREHEPKRSYLDTAQQIGALLAAAGELDVNARENRQHVRRRGMIATLMFGGLRIGELCALRWRGVDLAGGWLQVADSKTDAGRRKVRLRGALRDELLSIRAAHDTVDQDGFVFPTSTGARFTTNKLRKRVLAPAVKLASERLVALEFAPLPEKITPHSLRRTFAKRSVRDR